MLKTKQKLGKYRVDKRLAAGGFATVYRAHDTIEGIDVALKVPHPHLMTGKALADFEQEVRITAKLDHPNILLLKNADFIDGLFIIAYPLGEASLEERLVTRVPFRTAFNYAEQLLEALAHAHSRDVLHCDVKPDNIILFPDGRLRLSDFGIAKFALRTLSASGSGTLGYVAPEQAMGKPTFRSDCFSAGLVLYRLFSGKLPTWPYRPPHPGQEILRRRVHSDLIALIHRAIEVDEKRRFADATQMNAALKRIRPRVLAAATRRRRRTSKRNGEDWLAMQRRQFVREFRKSLNLRHSCSKCKGPVSEAMLHCPWCGASRKVYKEETRFPARCKRCGRGLKLDWRFCPWCYGAAVGPKSDRTYSDVRYTGRCSNQACDRRDLMAHMRYCPWCRQKVKRRWRLESGGERCAGCGWDVAAGYWKHCAWCGRTVGR